MINLFKNLFTKQEESMPSKALLELEAIQQRNQKRMETIKAEMGDKWILAKCHTKSKLDMPRPV